MEKLPNIVLAQILEKIPRRELEDSTPDHSRFEYSPATDL